jgi:hypothetical protein
VDEPARVLPLGKPQRRQGVLIPVEAEEHFSEGRMVGGGLLVGRELQRPRLRCRREVAQSTHVRYGASLPEPSGDLQDGFLPHPVDEQVGLGVDQDGAADPVRPGIVVGDPPEACLDPPQDDRFGRFEMVADEVGVGDTAGRDGGSWPRP